MNQQEIEQLQLRAVALLQAQGLFTTYGGGESEVLARHLSIHMYDADGLLTKEGDIGDAAYVVLSGGARASCRGPNGELIDLGAIPTGTIIGEQAILGPTALARTATVQCTQPTLVARIDHATFLEFLDEETRSHINKVARDRAFGRMKAISAAFAAIPIETATARSETVAIPEGHVIFREGDTSDRAYFVVNGRIAITRGEQRREIAIIEPGQLFGEVGVLEGAPRGADARAMTDCNLIAMPWSVFRRLHDKSPELRAMTSTLWRAYALSGGRTVTISQGEIAGHPAICALHDLRDGRTAFATRAVDDQAFTMRISGGIASDVISWRSHNQSRDLMISQDRIIGIEVSGPWTNLGVACAMLMEGTRVPGTSLAAFKLHGELPEAAKSGMVCACAGLTADDLTTTIRSGGTTLDAITQATAAGTSCGSCVPLIAAALQGHHG